MIPSRRQLLLAALLMGGAGAGWRGFYRDLGFAPWQGPPAGADAVQRMVAWASLAPSFRNLQPWQVRLAGPDRLQVFADASRARPLIDPDLRLLTQSVGAFLELLELAAQAEGLSLSVAVFPHNPYTSLAECRDRPVAEIAWQTTGKYAPAIFAAVAGRGTVRGPYDKTALKEAEVASLREVLRGVPVGFRLTDRGGEIERLRGIIDSASGVLLGDPGLLRERAQDLRLEPAEAARGDGIVAQPMLLAAAVEHTFGRGDFADPGSVMTRLALKAAVAETAGTSAFGCLTTAGDSRLDQLTAGRALLRLELAATIAGLASHVRCEGVALARNDLNALLAGPGETVQAVVRLGRRSGHPPHSPRRPLADILTA